MTESFKRKQKTLMAGLTIITLISVMAPQITAAANANVSGTTASIISFIVVVIAAFVNQFGINKRVNIAEILKDEEYTTSENESEVA